MILQVNGKDIDGANELRNEVAGMSPNTDVTLTLWRNGNQQQVHVKLGTLSAEAVQQPQSGNGNSQLGLTIEPLTPALASQLGISDSTPGLVVDSVDPNSAAADAGLQQGDVIQEVNRQPVRSQADLSAALQKSGTRPALMLINRGNQRIFIAVPLTR